MSVWERRVQPRSAVERSEGTRLTDLRNDKQETLLVTSKQSFALLTSNLLCAVPTTSRVSGSSWRRGCEVLISQAAVSQPLRVSVQVDLFLAEDVAWGGAWSGRELRFPRPACPGLLPAGQGVTVGRGDLPRRRQEQGLTWPSAGF